MVIENPPNTTINRSVNMLPRPSCCMKKGDVDKKKNKTNEKSYFINPQQKMKNLFIKYHI